MPSKVLEPGAGPLSGRIPLCVPHIGGNERAYVEECLKTGWVSSVGPFVERFEREFAAACGAAYAVATTSGTAALHTALLLAGVQPGDEVILPSLTFIAPANAVRYVGAWPTFVDVDLDYWQLDPAELRAFLQDDCRGSRGQVRNRHTGRRVAAILPVDILGHPCDLPAIQEIAEHYGLAVVEDATESLGARCRGKPLGQWSPLTCFSFNANKVITTGGGGMLVTDDSQLARRARYLTTQAKDDPLEFVHQEIGYNYRLTSVQAALGCAQLERLPAFLATKRRIATRYAEALEELTGIQPMKEAPWATASYWMYTILVDAEQCAIDSRTLLKALAASNIETRPLWQPLHLSPAHRESFARSCPVASRLNQLALSIPCSTSLTEAEQHRVITALRREIRGDRSNAQMQATTSAEEAR
jgi:perosamine synthetase